MMALPYRVICGDCVEVLKTFRRGSFNAVVGDGPYSAHTHANMKGNRGRNVKGEKKIVARDIGFRPIALEEVNAHTREFCRVASDWIILFSDDWTLPWWRDGIQAAGGVYGRTIPWTRWSSPNFAKAWPPSGAEFIAVARPSKLKKSMSRWINGSRTHYDAKCLRAKSIEKTSLLEWSPDPEYPGSQAQKPEGLMVDILGDCCSRGMTVVDPYAASGTTGVAALRLGLRVLLIEKDPAMARMCQGRMDREWQRLSRHNQDHGIELAV